MRVTARWLTLFLVLLCGSSCGYLDQDLFTEDEAFDESFATGGLGLHGFGFSSGCGGFGRLGPHRHRHPSIGMGGLATLELEAMHISAMSDRDILESTEIGIIDESAPEQAEPAATSLPAQAYYEQLDERNRAITELY